MRPIRSSLPAGLYELCTRVTGDAMLMVPSEEVNDVILGVLGRALHNHPQIQLHVFVFMSTHYHMLVTAPNGPALSKFEGFLNGQLARRINRLRGRRGAFWEGRFNSAYVDSEEDNETSRLRYLLAHGVKEGLVAHAEQWPGISSLPALRDGHTMHGVWRDLSSLGYASRREEDLRDLGDEGTSYPIIHVPLPSWKELSELERRERVRRVVDDEADEAATYAAASGVAPLGVERVMGADPFQRIISERRPRRRVLARVRAVARALVEMLREREWLWLEAASKAMALLAGAAGEGDRLPAHLWRGLAVNTV